MSRMQERIQQRREYVWKKARAHLKGEAGVGLFLIGSVSGILSGIIALLLLLATILLAEHPLACLGWSIVAGGICLASALIARWGWRWLDGFDQADHLPHVPPVTPATLPSDEVLVRGSDQLPATPDTLLRTAISGEETLTEQLPRSSQDQQ